MKPYTNQQKVSFTYLQKILKKSGTAEPPVDATSRQTLTRLFLGFVADFTYPVQVQYLRNPKHDR
jgi:hypothetical protein